MTASRPDLLLFDADGSPCARRVKISLIEKGLRFRTHRVDLAGLEQRHPAYLAVNPNGLVPTLVHNGFSIWESNVITEYLDDAFPEKPLYPATAAERAQAKGWQTTELALAKTFRPLMYSKMLGPMVRLAASLDEVLDHAKQVTDDPAFLDWERKVWRLEVLTEEQERLCAVELTGYLDRLEAGLQGRKYLLGESFTTADISMFPRVRMYRYVNLPISAAMHPNVRRWLDMLERRPSFKRTQSQAERGMDVLMRSGAMKLIQHAARHSKAEQTLWQRFVLSLLRPVLRRVLGYAGRASRRTRGAFPVCQSSPRTAQPAWFPADTRPTGTVDVLGDPEDIGTVTVLAACRALGIAYRLKVVDASLMEQRSARYLATCPSGELPALKDGALVINGVGAIVDHLCVRGGDASLIGGDAELRARIRMWHAFDSGMHKEARPFMYRHALRPRMQTRFADEAEFLAALPAELSAADRGWIRSVWRDDLRIDMGAAGAQAVMTGKLDKLEARLADRRYLADSDKPSFADLALGLRVMRLDRHGFDAREGGRDNIDRWLIELNEHFDLDGLWSSLEAVAA